MAILIIFFAFFLALGIIYTILGIKEDITGEKDALSLISSFFYIIALIFLIAIIFNSCLN